MSIRPEEDTLTTTLPDTAPPPGEMAGWHRFYGVDVTHQDGDGGVHALIAAGFPGRRHALAAFNQYCRRVLGWERLSDRLPGVADPAGLVRERWAVLAPTPEDAPIYGQLAPGWRLAWDGVDALTADSFPVTVLEPGPHITTEETE